MNDFESVKKNLPIKETVLSLTGLKMKGPHLEKCPLCGGHDCFSIQDDKGIFKCFQCDARGDVITFIEKFEGLTPKEARESRRARGNSPHSAPLS